METLFSAVSDDITMATHNSVGGSGWTLDKPSPQEGGGLQSRLLRGAVGTPARSFQDLAGQHHDLIPARAVVLLQAVSLTRDFETPPHNYSVKILSK